MDFVDKISKRQDAYASESAPKALKNLGQFFTPASVARYMASLVDIPDSSVRFLDAGAGVGILASAFVERLANEHRSTPIHVVAYETEPGASVLLQKTLQEAVEVYGRVGGTLSWEVVSEDFVLSRPDRSAKDFDISILNPPYFKVHSTLSRYSGATKDVFKGNPNIYAACGLNNYALTDVVLGILRTFREGDWRERVRTFLASTDSNYGFFRHPQYATDGTQVLAWDAGHVTGAPPFAGVIDYQPFTLAFDTPLLAWGADIIGFGFSPISDYFNRDGCHKERRNRPRVQSGRRSVVKCARLKHPVADGSAGLDRPASQEPPETRNARGAGKHLLLRYLNASRRKSNEYAEPNSKRGHRGAADRRRRWMGGDHSRR